MKTIVIKVGGALLACDKGVARLFDTLRALDQGGYQAVLVHGGGDLVAQQLAANGFESKKHNGLRITPEEQMDVVAGALAGSANTQLTAAAIGAGLLPVGLTLADGGLTHAEVLDPELGKVGKVTPADPTLLKQLVSQGVLPVVASIAVTPDGQRLNVNADQAATAICSLLGAELVLLSDVSGVLDGKGQLIPSLDPAKARELVKLGVIEGGMQVKVDAALDAARAINNRVLVASWRYPEHLAALVRGEPVGTEIHP